MYSSEMRGGLAKPTEGPVADPTAAVVFPSMYHAQRSEGSEASVQRERLRRPETVTEKPRRRRSGIMSW
jgi:hypothetical protein